MGRQRECTSIWTSEPPGYLACEAGIGAIGGMEGGGLFMVIHLCVEVATFRTRSLEVNQNELIPSLAVY